MAVLQSDGPTGGLSSPTAQARSAGSARADRSDGEALGVLPSTNGKSEPRFVCRRQEITWVDRAGTGRMLPPPGRAADGVRMRHPGDRGPGGVADFPDERSSTPAGATAVRSAVLPVCFRGRVRQQRLHPAGRVPRRW